jgi:hypothetical protein
MNHDYIVDVIEQIAQTIARLVGLRERHRHDEAKEAIDDALRGAFGPLRETLDELEPEGVPGLVDNAEKLALYVALLRESARVADGEGLIERARALAVRADAIERAR